MLERYFALTANKTTWLREILAGTTTFLTMSYILFLQPMILSQDFAGQPTGLSPQAIFFATAVASGFATVLMGLYGKLPVALAPGMGQNYFFVSVIMALGTQKIACEPWQGALGIVFVAGILFLVLTMIGARKAVLDIMSPSMRAAIAVGIGLFIAMIGLKNANVIVSASSLVKLNAEEFMTIDSAIFWGGLLTTLILAVQRVPGSILIGIVATSIAAFWFEKVTVNEVVSVPDITNTALFQFSLKPAFSLFGLTFVVVFLFMDIFDTTGTLVAVTKQAKLTDGQGNLPSLREAMMADSLGTVFGAAVGTSTVTSYIESAAGVEQGGRTGLTALTTGVLFFASLLLGPFVIAFGQYAPITAPAMVVVGSLMFRAVKDIDWGDETESIPAFLVIVGIPLFFSIADGIALGLIVWPILKMARWRWNEIPWATYFLFALLLAYFMLIRPSI